ncbi:MAG: glycoside hydrolase family 26 protein [Chloroflexota bacterium]
MSRTRLEVSILAVATLVAGVALVVGLNLVGLARYHGVGPQESWQEAAAYLEQQTRPGDVVLAGQPSTLGSAGVYFGAWVGDRVNVPGDVGRFEEAIGKRLAIVHRYSDNPPHRGQRFDSAWADSVREAGSIPMLSWQPGFGYGTRSLSQVAQGERDDYMVPWADQLRDWGHPIFLRMMWEQNSSWFGWRAYQEPQSSEFVAAWRHVVDVFRARGASNVTFVWSPHVSGNGASEIMPTYPGDDYVDWVALDGYPFRGGRGDFAETFGPDYDLLASSLDKPIMIAETSLDSWSDETKAEWIRDILGNQIPNRFPRVKALVWFEEKNTDGIHYSILEGQGPMSRDAFREEMASPYYASNRYGGLEASPIPPPDAPQGVGGEGAAAADRGAETVTVVGDTAPVEGVPANLVVDPGFELGGADGRWNPAWVVPSWVSVVRRDGGAAASGGYSMLHSSGGGESYTVYQELPVEAGASYDLSVTLLVEEGLRYGKANLEVQFLNQYGGVVESRPAAGWQEATDGWTRIEGSVRAARGAARARIQIKVTSLRGTFRLDDFSFTRSVR